MSGFEDDIASNNSRGYLKMYYRGIWRRILGVVEDVL